MVLEELAVGVLDWMNLDSELVKDIEGRMILHWNYRNLTQLPQELLSHHGQHIQEIYLKRNSLETLPMEIGNLKNLTNLYLVGNQISALPTEISQLVSLKVLDLSENQLRNIPQTIKYLTALEHLMITQNHLEDLPRELGDLGQLKFLELSGNCIEEIPNEVIRGLTSLEQLGVDRNPIRFLPRGISCLPNLQYVSACQCDLLYLPSVPFQYLLNYGNGSASEKSSRDFKLQFDSNPKLNYLPYWVIQLLGPEVDCFGCATDDEFRVDAGPKFPHSTGFKPKKGSNRFSLSKIQLDLNGRKKIVNFDEDLINIKYDGLKEPSTLLELCFRAVHVHELLSRKNNTCHQLDNTMGKIDAEYKSSNEMTIQDDSNGGHDLSTSSRVVNSMKEDVQSVSIDDSIVIPQKLRKTLERGPFTKCFKCMTPLFTSTRPVMFCHKQSERDFRQGQGVPRPNDYGIVLASVHFCGNDCLSKFCADESKNISGQRGSNIILENEIPWRIFE